MACKPVRATAIKQHKILGYAGSDAIKQLPKYINSAELTELITERAPLKIECETCSIAKHTQQISRRREHEFPATRPFERLAFDIISLGEPGYNGDKYIMHFYCMYSKFNFVYTAKNKDKATVLPTIRKTHRLIKIRFPKTLSSSGAMMNVYLDKRKTPYRHGVGTKASLLNAGHRIPRNKTVEQNDLDEPLQYGQELCKQELPYHHLQDQRRSLLPDMHLIKYQMSSQAGRLPTRLFTASRHHLPICTYTAVRRIYWTNELKGEISQLLMH